MNVKIYTQCHLKRQLTSYCNGPNNYVCMACGKCLTDNYLSERNILTVGKRNVEVNLYVTTPSVAKKAFSPGKETMCATYVEVLHISIVDDQDKGH